MAGYDRVDCRLHNNTAYSTGVNTRDDRAVLVQYITRALSTGVVKSEDSGFCSTNINLGHNQQGCLQTTIGRNVCTTI